jgi:hypothetical protein
MARYGGLSLRDVLGFYLKWIRFLRYLTDRLKYAHPAPGMDRSPTWDKWADVSHAAQGNRAG